MKKMKRLWACVLSVAVLLSCGVFSTIAVAAATDDLTKDNFALDINEANGTLSIDLNCNKAVNAWGGAAGTMAVKNASGVDAGSWFTLDSVQSMIGDKNDDKTSAKWSTTANDYNNGDNLQAGTWATYQYTVSDDIPAGTYTFTMSFSDGDCYDNDLVDYTCSTQSVEGQFVVSGPTSYTVTLEADTETADIGETVTVAVKVDKPVNGIAATVSYDKNLFTYAGETDANGNIVVSGWSETATQSIAELEFVAKNDGADDATGTFAFASANVYAGAYEDFKTDAVPATTVSDTVKVLARTYTVGVTSDENGDVTGAPATGVKSGTEVTLTVVPNAGYELETLIVNDNDVTANVENNQYTFTMPAANVAVNATFKKSAPTFTVAIKDGDYVTGYTLVTVTGQNAGGYTYNGSAMFDVEQYNAYAILVEGSVTEEDAIAAVAEVASGTPTAISAGYDVNGTNKVDFNDAGAAFGCLNVVYGVADNMAMYLRADVNGDKIVNSADVNTIMQNYTNK